MGEVSHTVRPGDSLSRPVNWVMDMIERGIQGGELVITLSRPRRSTDQNRKMWALLRDVASQRQLVINGAMVWADEEDWKDVFTAAYRQETRMAQGVGGGVVMLGMRTSRMRKQELSELIELIYAYGSEWGVEWSDESQQAMEAA